MTDFAEFKNTAPHLVPAGRMDYLEKRDKVLTELEVHLKLVRADLRDKMVKMINEDPADTIQYRHYSGLALLIEQIQEKFHLQ